MEVRDYMAVQNLIHRYAELLDGGDVDTLAGLFAEADFHKPNALFSRDAGGLAAYWREWVRFYADQGGTPRTRHLVTNVIVEFESDEVATARSHITVIQATEALALQPIISVTNHDRFHKREGVWHFAERREYPALVGDLSAHLLKPAPVG
jgi:hypothetical protein